MKKFLISPITWAIAAALLVCLPLVNHYDFFATDCIHMGVLEGGLDYPGLSSFGLYQFSDGTPEHNALLSSKGLWPWFLNPHWKINFCRHLPSFLTSLNHQVSGINPKGYFLHSLAWYIALIVIIGVLTIPLLAAAGKYKIHPATYLSLIIFAVSMSHGEAIFYGAARWIIMAAFFSILGLWAHIRWREKGWSPGRLLALFSFIIALLCGEAALAALAYLAAYELFGSRGDFKTRIKAISPILIIVTIYLIIYKIMGYGTSHIGIYSNPLSDPLAYITQFPEKFSSILGEMSVGIMSIFYIPPMLPSLKWLVLGVGAGTIILFTLLFIPLWLDSNQTFRRTLNWILAGTLGSTIPLASAAPGGRVALIPFIGGSILLALCLHYWGCRLRKNLKSPKAWLAALLCGGLLFIHLGLNPYHWYKDSKLFSGYIKARVKSQVENPINQIKSQEEVFFLDNGNDITWIYDAFAYRHLHRLPMPKTWWQLSFSTQTHHYRRTGENTLELVVLDDRSMVPFDVFGLYGEDSPLRKGAQTHLQGLKIEILDVDEKNNIHLVFTFPKSLDHKNYRFYRFQEGTLKEAQIPKIGGSLTLEAPKPQTED